MNEPKVPCTHPPGISVKPDGIHELDPCVYEDVEMHTNVTVIVSRCKNCGRMSLSWLRTADTEDIELVGHDGRRGDDDTEKNG